VFALTFHFDVNSKKHSCDTPAQTAERSNHRGTDMSHMVKEQHTALTIRSQP
jgi:hypothetical protein